MVNIAPLCLFLQCTIVSGYEIVVPSQISVSQRGSDCGTRNSKSSGSQTCEGLGGVPLGRKPTATLATVAGSAEPPAVAYVTRHTRGGSTGVECGAWRSQKIDLLVETPYRPKGHICGAGFGLY